MKLETSERLFVQTLVEESMRNARIDQRGTFRIEKLTGDASTRRYYRVNFDSDSYVVCLDTPRENASSMPDFLSIQKILEQSSVRVPHILDLDTEKGYYLEEDLGDKTFLRRLSECQDRQEELKLYNKAVDLLIGLHSLDINLYQDQVFTQRAFDLEKLMMEMNFTRHHFVCGLMGQNNDDPIVQSIFDAFESICQRICCGPWVFTHRDYHSRNIMIKNEELVVIDFQDARLGLPQYDLCSLLEDCYYQLSHENHAALIERYWQGAGQKHWPQGKQDFLLHYSLMSCQRIFKAIGSFAYIYRLRGDIRYLRHIGRAFERLKEVLFALEDYQELRRQLCGIYYAY